MWTYSEWVYLNWDRSVLRIFKSSKRPLDDCMLPAPRISFQSCSLPGTSLSTSGGKDTPMPSFLLPMLRSKQTHLALPGAFLPLLHCLRKDQATPPLPSGARRGPQPGLNEVFNGSLNSLYWSLVLQLIKSSMELFRKYRFLPFFQDCVPWPAFPRFYGSQKVL